MATQRGAWHTICAPTWAWTRTGDETTMARGPLQLGELDHYTLIVRDAKAVADFHVEVLGFRPSRIQLVNAGAAPPERMTC